MSDRLGGSAYSARLLAKAFLTRHPTLLDWTEARPPSGNNNLGSENININNNDKDIYLMFNDYS